jgi:hypothetical protein
MSGSRAGNTLNTALKLRDGSVTGVPRIISKNALCTLSTNTHNNEYREQNNSWTSYKVSHQKSVEKWNKTIKSLRI